MTLNGIITQISNIISNFGTIRNVVIILTVFSKTNKSSIIIIIKAFNDDIRAVHHIISVDMQIFTPTLSNDVVRSMIGLGV